jgi:hypothetical protein
MATQKQTQDCSACQGGGIVSAGGQAMVCPLCDGSGKSFVPGLFYTYAATTTLTALGTGVLTISILNAPFKWVFACSQQTGAFTIGIADAKNSRQFFFSNTANNVPGNQLHYALVFGNAQNPFPVLNPYIFPQNGAIQIALTDLSNANNTIWLGFVGLELVPTQSQGGQ